MMPSNNQYAASGRSGQQANGAFVHPTTNTGGPEQNTGTFENPGQQAPFGPAFGATFNPALSATGFNPAIQGAGQNQAVFSQKQRFPGFGAPEDLMVFDLVFLSERHRTESEKNRGFFKGCIDRLRSEFEHGEEKSYAMFKNEFSKAAQFLQAELEKHGRAMCREMTRNRNKINRRVRLTALFTIVSVFLLFGVVAIFATGTNPAGFFAGFFGR